MRVEPEGYQRSDLDPVGGLGDYPPRGWPLWARWNGELDQRYTIGVEEEVMLLEPATVVARPAERRGAPAALGRALAAHLT